MKVAVLCVPFVTCERHVSSALTTLQSARTLLLDGQLTIKAVVNRCDNQVWRDQIGSAVDSYEENSKNILSLAWNKGIQSALAEGNQYVMVVNLDVVLHPLLLEKLLALALARPDAVMWSGYEVDTAERLMEPVPDQLLESYANFSCFLVNDGLFSRVGEFDTRFVPAYHEDADMVYRMRLSGTPAIGLTSARFYHTGQGTLKGILANKDEELALQIRNAMNESMDRYAEKWGGLPGHERFLSPFNKT